MKLECLAAANAANLLQRAAQNIKPFSKSNANSVWPPGWIDGVGSWRRVFIEIISLPELQQQMQRQMAVIATNSPKWNSSAGYLECSLPHLLISDFLPSRRVEEVTERSVLPIWLFLYAFSICTVKKDEVLHNCLYTWLRWRLGGVVSCCLTYLSLMKTSDLCAVTRRLKSHTSIVLSKAFSLV